MTNPTTPAPPAVPLQLQNPATWVPVLHTLVAAALGALAVFWPNSHEPNWLSPALLLLAVIVFIAGVALYLWHRDRWTKATGEGLVGWVSTLLPTLSSEVRDLKAALPPQLSARLAVVETRLEPLEGAVRQLGALVGPIGSILPLVTTQMAPRPPAAAGTTQLPPIVPIAAPAAPERPLLP